MIVSEIENVKAIIVKEDDFLYRLLLMIDLFRT